MRSWEPLELKTGWMEWSEELEWPDELEWSDELERPEG